MTVFLVILGLVVYVVIGGVISGIINEEEMEAACIFAWPLLLVLGLFAALYFLAKGLGENLAKRVRKYFDKEE